MSRRAALIAFVCSLLTAAACSIQDSEELTPDSSGAGASGGSGSGASSGEPAASASGSGAAGATGTSSGQGGGGGGAVVPQETPNSIACGAEECSTPDEMCCGDDTGGSCVASTDGVCPFTTGRLPGGVTAQCDDAADCGDDQVCCVTSGINGTLYACSTIEACEGYESCIPDGGCSRGMTCVADDDEFSGAKCVGASASVTCGSTACVVGEFCCNDQSPVCLPAGSDCMHSYECDSPSDCGPDASCCDDGFGGSMCTWGSCFQLTFCAMDAECPKDGTCSAQTGLDVPDGFQVCN